MNKFHNIFEKYIKDSEKRKRYVAFLLSLSMLVMFFVPLGLTENADSMTALSPGGAILTEQLKNAVNTGMLAEQKHNIAEANELKIYINDGDGNSLYANVNGVEQTPEVTQSSGNNIEFQIEYVFSDVGHLNYEADKAYFYVEILNTDTTKAVLNLINVSKDNNVYVKDIDYESFTGRPAGYLVIENNVAYVCLYDEYISYVNQEDREITKWKWNSNIEQYEETSDKVNLKTAEATGEIKGTIQFEGEFNRSSSSNEGAIKINGKDDLNVTINLPERETGLSLSKSGSKLEDGTGIKWTITLNKNAGIDLNGYSLEDAMLAKAKADSITVKAGETVAGEYSNGKITFKNEEAVNNAETITIEYTTPLDNILGELDTNNDNTVDVDYIDNTAYLKKTGEEDKQSNKSTVNINKPTLTKDGKPDYQNSGKAENKIDWTIKINNNGGLNLKGYTIEDSKFPTDANAIEIEYNGTKVKATATNNTITLPDNIGNPQEIKIKYQSTATSEKDASGNPQNRNNATLKKGNLIISTDSKNPEYKTESAMYKIQKDAGVFNPDTGLITWTVTVEATDGMKLTGYKISDSAFRGKKYEDFKFQLACVNDTNNPQQSQYTSYPEKFIKIDDDTLTFQNGFGENNGLVKVVFTYTTPATQSDAPTTQTNSIALENPKGTTLTSVVASADIVAIRNTFTKSVDQTSKNIGKTNGATDVTLHWTVTLISDDGFADKKFDDIFTAEYDGKDLSSKIENVHLYPRDTQYGSNKTEITSGFTASGADITFNNDFNINEHYIVLTYDTVVTLPAVTDSSKYDSNGKITYNIKNNGGGDFGPGPGQGEVGVTITRENPNSNNTSISFTKQWNNKPDNINKIYVYVTATGNNKTYYLAGSEKNYKLVETATYESASASGNGVLFEVSGNDSNWNKSFTGLPTSKEVGGNVVYYNNYTVHEYSISDTTDSNKFGNKNYVKLSDGSIIVKSGSGNSITNTYYPNKELTVKKSWDGDTGSGTGITSVTVQVERKASNSSEWKPYGSAVTIPHSVSLDSKKLSSTFPTAEIKDNDVVTYEYRVVETVITASGKEFTKKTSENNKVIFVDESGNYYETNESATVGTSNTEVTLTNTYHKADAITITAQKKWVYNGSEYTSLEALRNAINNITVDNYLKSIDVKLQRRVQGSGDAGWEDVKDTKGAVIKHTISATDTASVEWNNLPNQAMVDNELVKYEYRVVECGFTTIFNDDGTKVDNHVNVTGNVIAPSPTTGRYDISYDGGSSNDKNVSSESKTITVKNTYVADSITSVTPKKNWTYDSNDNDYNKKENRADSVTFVLQQYDSKNNRGKWVDYKSGDSNVTVTFTKSANESNGNNANWTQYTVSPEGFDLTKLPKEWLEKEIVDSTNNIRKYTIVQYQYRFVETSVTVNGEDIPLNYENDDIYAGNLTGETAQIKSIDGKFISTISGSTVENKFKPNKGIEKYSVDSHANKVESIDTEELEQYKHTLSDGKEYYVFNYVIEFTKTESKSILDTLQEGFSLVTEIHSSSEAGDYKGSTENRKLSLYSGLNSKDSYWKTPGCIEYGGIKYKIADGYYAAPMIFIMSDTGNEYAAYFGEITESALNDKYGKYNYNESERELSLGYVNVDSGTRVCYAYSIKIEKAELEKKLADGTFSIVNQAKKYETNGTDTGLSSENTLTITKPNNLIKKDFAETNIPGYVTYTIDVNPDGKTLSNGSTVRIKDVFDTISYTLRDNCSVHKKTGGHNPVTTEGSRLIDVMLNSLNVYAYDANGNKTELKSNQYTSVFKNGADAEEGAATLELNVPDSTHISIEYTYKLIANENTPSVIQGCKSTTLKNGRYPIMASGMIPPAGDKISMRNKARLETESNSAEKEKIVNEYEIAESSGTISTTKLPKIRKVNIADQTINDLKADFLLARYIENEKGEKGWQYATNIGDKNNAKNRDVTWSEEFSNTTIPEDVFKIELDGKKAYEVNLSDGVLYKLIEVKVPDKYEGSNLKKVVDGKLVDFTADDYEALITNYFNTKETKYEGTDYSNFLTTFVFEHYFVYNAIPSSIARPATLNTNDVMQIQTGGIVDVPNNELIDIKIQKDWVNFDENVDIEDTSVILQLFWSDKNEDSIPDNAKPAEANELGIVNYEGINEEENYAPFSSVVEVPYGTDATTVWTQLPNGNGLTPIYYYVKEIGYRIGKGNNSTLYMLEETVDPVTEKTISTYKQAESYKEVLPEKADEQVTVEVKWVENPTKFGNYLPTYVNNAVNSNVSDSDSVKITNSKVLRLKKVWTDAENNILPANSGKIGTNSIDVAIYGVYANKAQTSEPLFTATLKRENGWIAEISQETLENIDLSQFESFVAKETGLPTLSEGKAFITSVTFRINNNTGEITVTNKNPDAVSASVSVNKTWSDGNDVHKSDSIEVTLYQVEKSKADAENLGDSPTLEQLTKVSAVVYNPQTSTTTTAEGAETSAETSTVPYNPVTLNAANNWSHVWSGLPIDDGAETAAKEYVYYVVESAVNISQNADKYTSTVELVKSGSNYAYTISNNRPSVTVKKEWYDENGKPLLVYDEDGNLDAEHSKNPPDNEVEVRLYKEGNSVPESNLKIQTYGDSITAGSGYNQSGASYADFGYLETTLGDNALFKDKVTINVGRTANGGEELDYLNDKTVVDNINAVCIMLGTNNVLHKVPYGKGAVYIENNVEKSEDYEALIRKLVGDNKSKSIFIATIPYLDYIDDFSSNNPSMKLRDWSEYNTKYGVEANNWTEAQRVMNLEIDKYNEYVRQVAAALNADDYKVTVVDVNKALTGENNSVVKDYYWDGCHLSTTGVAKMNETFANAIVNYYTPKEYIAKTSTDENIVWTKNVADAKTYKITADGNWTTVIDLSKNFDTSIKLSVEEVANESLTNWTAEYENNSQTALSSEVIVVKNTNTPPETTIEIKKKWENDTDNTDGRAKMAFRIFRTTDPADPTKWEEVVAERDETFGENGILKNADGINWTIRFKKFPAKSPKNETYYYKIEEEPLAGYTCSVDTSVKEAVKDQTITFKATNTRAMSITVEKFWDDKDKDTSHDRDTVKVRLWRTTEQSKVGNLPLSLMVKKDDGTIIPSGSSVSMGKETTMTLTANRTEATFESDKPDIVSVENGTLTAHEAGTAQVTVSAGNEKVVINVEVVALTLNVPESITAGDTAKATVSADGKTITDISYSSSNTNVLTIDNDGNITAHDVGPAEITVTCDVDGKEMHVSKSITVGYTDGFTLADENGNVGTTEKPIEIAINSEIKLTPTPAYGDYFEFGIKGEGATIAQDGKSVTVKAGNTAEKTVTVKATRTIGNAKTESTCVIKVVDNPEFQLFLNRKDVTDSYPLSSTGQTIDYFEIPMKTGLVLNTNKVIKEVKQEANNWEYSVTKTGEKEITLGVGNNGENVVTYNKWFEITYYKSGNSGETETKKYNARLIEQPAVKISATPSTVIVNNETTESQTVQITAEEGATIIPPDSFPNGVTYDSVNHILTIEKTASKGTITFTATKDNFANGTCEVKISDGKEVGKVEGTNIFKYNIPTDKQKNITSISVKISGGNIINGDGLNVYLNSESSNNSWVNFNNNNGQITSISGYQGWDNYFDSYSCNGLTFTLSNRGSDKSDISYIAFKCNNSSSITIESIEIINSETFSLRVAPMAILASEPEQASGITWTDNGDGREYYEFDIHANPDNWRKTITGLEVAKDGKLYYYWVEETPVPVNYDASYSYDGEFEKRFIQQTDGTVVIKNTQRTTFEGVEMPSTGGNGTKPYTTAGIIITGGAVLTLLARRRKRKSA